MSNKDTKKSGNEKNILDYDFETWKMAWKCRDFELSHLWQRSIFLTAFIIAAYTGYGIILIKLVDYLTIYTIDAKILLFLNIISIFIGLIGYSLSILYIAMAKGSKYWYENYECLISHIEWNVFNEKLYAQNVNKGEEKPEINDALFSTSAGKYSVSRINIAIGWISSIVWFLIVVTHVYFLIIGNYCPISTIVTVLSILFIFGVHFFIIPKIKSST